MPYDIGLQVAPDGVPAVVIQARAEAMPAIELLRLLKKTYPELYKLVHHELVLPDGVTRNGDRTTGFVPNPPILPVDDLGDEGDGEEEGDG